MTFDLTSTSPSEIIEVLTKARHRMGGGAMGMVLTLVIVTDEANNYDSMRAATEAGREHPSRVIGLIRRDERAESRIDAEIRVGETGPGETVLLRVYGKLSDHADSVIAPLLVPDSPVVTWWPGRAPATPHQDAVGALAQRRITDVLGSPSPLRQLGALAERYAPGDTDLCWTRLTPWRTLLASTLDHPYGSIEKAVVTGEDAHPSAELLAAWLMEKLGVPVEREVSGGPGLTDVRLHTDQGEIALHRPDGRVATLSWPGQPDRMVALHRRTTAELIAEELRRLDPDEVYGETLKRAADTFPPPPTN